jgi:hypothetical protein
LKYRALCEVGTHPIPNQRPGYYSTHGRPVLGLILQPAGVFTCINELCWSLAASATFISDLIQVEAIPKEEIRHQSKKLLMELGSFDILNYEKLLDNARQESEDNFVTISAEHLSHEEQILFLLFSAGATHKSAILEAIEIQDERQLNPLLDKLLSQKYVKVSQDSEFGITGAGEVRIREIVENFSSKNT